MGPDLMVFAIVMACLAAAVVVFCMFSEFTEAWDISHRGWVKGHRQHHSLRHHHGAE
ncbi:MAG: hypothetical protein ABI345_11535 [Jatrophihabitans sp.]